ncbi:hypothetical protein PAEPH01_0550 [Pancytospora epiphaga]|nr:hypothetical protein PAEPH01_0550 [Pancytospora epiphaga]
MIFGSNPTYLYGEVFKDKFVVPEKAYKIDTLPVSCTECPARFIDGAVEIFFPGPIFNTYVETEEDKICVLKSYDSKLTIIKKKQPSGRLLTVKTIREDEKVREVELYRYDEFFPGYRTSGEVELSGGKKIIHTGKGTGAIVFQNNEQNGKCECILYKIEKQEYYFAEINNPVVRCTVKVDKDMRGTKIVSNGNIKGVLVDCKTNKTEIDVYVKRVCLGSYIFIEDIKGGIATVKLQEKGEGEHKVVFKGFVGTCMDSKVSETMKGVIYEINGNTFKFKQLNEKELSSVEEKRKRTEDFEDVVVEKKIKIETEEMIGNDQFRAIDYIKNQIEKDGNTKSILPLLNKYILTVKDRNHICLFYLKYLETIGLISASEVSRMMKITSPAFLSLVTTAFDSKLVLEEIYRKKHSKACFLKLLDLADDKGAFIRGCPEYNYCGIEYIYKHMKNPRLVVESVIDSSFRSWMVYLRHEAGPYKRGLFRRLIKMKLKKEEAKQAFKLWHEFEESVHGNVDEVKEQARMFVEANK